MRHRVGTILKPFRKDLNAIVANGDCLVHPRCSCMFVCLYVVPDAMYFPLGHGPRIQPMRPSNLGAAAETGCHRHSTVLNPASSDPDKPPPTPSGSPSVRCPNSKNFCGTLQVWRVSQARATGWNGPYWTTHYLSSRWEIPIRHLAHPPSVLGTKYRGTGGSMGRHVSRLAFLLSTGICQVRASMSISDQSARRASPDRVAVSTRNSNESLVESLAPDSWTRRRAAGTSVYWKLPQFVIKPALLGQFGSLGQFGPPG